MSKKQLRRRLDNLFADLEQETSLLDPANKKPVQGWTFECDGAWNYVACSSEVEDILGIQASRFLNQSLLAFQTSESTRPNLIQRLNEGQYPIEIDLEFISAQGETVPAKLHLLRPPEADADQFNDAVIRGYVHVREAEVATPHPFPPVPESPPPSTPTASRPTSAATRPLGPAPARKLDPQDTRPVRQRAPNVLGYIAENGRTLPSNKILTTAGRQSLRSGQPIVQPRQDDSPAVMALSVPTMEGSQNLLLEILDEEGSYEWSDDERQLVSQVADQLSLALENAQLFKQTQERAEELSILREVALELAEEQHDLHSVLDIISRRAMYLLNSDGGGVWLWNEGEQMLELVLSHQVDGMQMVGRRLASGEGLSGRAYASRETAVVEDYQRWSDQPQVFTDVSFHAAMAVPMFWQTDVVGVLVVTRSKPDHLYSPNEIHLAELLAGQAAAVIQNANLFQTNLQLLNEVQEDRARYSDLYNRAPDCYFSLDATAQFIEFNQTGLSWLGLQREDVIETMRVEAILAAYSRDVFRKAFERLQLTGRIENLEVDFTRRDGSSFPVMVDATGIYDGAGNFTQARVIARDVTRLRQLEQRRLQLARAVEASADMVVITNIKGEIQFVNPAIERITGYTPEEAIGENPRILNSGMQDQAFYEQMWNTILSGEVWRGDLTNKRKDGSLFEAALTISPIVNERGEITQFVAVQRDVTAERQAAQEREHLLADISERAVQLQTAAEVSRAASSILEPTNLIQQTVDLIRERFELYYAGIFLVDEDGSLTNEPGRWAVLHTGTGEAGKAQVEAGHKLEIGGNSMIGQCVHTRETQIALHAEEEAARFVNPLLPDTRSEMAIPLISRGEVIGAMTIQDTRPNAFSEEDVAALRTMADQIANAIQNARLYSQAQNTMGELQTSERYQTSVAQAVAMLTQTGTSGLSEVLSILGEAAQVSRVYYFESDEDTEGAFWRLVGEWCAEGVASFQANPMMERVPIDMFAYWERSLRENGSISGHADEMPPAEQNMISSRDTQSILALTVPGRLASPGFIGFDENTKRREWGLDVIAALQTVASSLANTIERERILAETNRRNEELAALNNIIRAASQTLDVSGMLAEILDRVLLITGFDAGLISRLDKSSERLVLTVERNLPEMLVDRLTNVGLENTLCDMVYQGGEIITVTDFSKGAPVDVDSLIAMGLHSYLGVPLIFQEETLGTICIFSSTPMSIRAGLLDLMQAIGHQVGVAVENARLFEQTQDALAETESLYNASATINAALTYEEILQALYHHTVIGRGSRPLITLGYFDSPWSSANTPEWIDILARWRPDADRMSVPPRYPLQPFRWLVMHFKAEQPLFIEDTQTNEDLDDFSRAWSEEEGFRSVILLPLVIAGSWVGFIGSFYTRPNSFPESERRRLMTLASQAAIAIQNIRLLDETRRRADQLQTAAEIARDTSSTLDLDQLLHRSVAMIRDRFEFSHASIFMLDEAEEYAVVRASTGEAGAEMLRQGHRLAVGSQSIIGYVTAKREPLVVNDVAQDPIHRPHPLLPETQAELGIPLIVGERVIGALDVQSTKINAFSQEDIEVIKVLADQIAVAVDNARAYEISLQAMEEMRRADQLKSQFLANMSHELRTPLNSIIGFSRVILKEIDGPVTDLQQQDLTAIYNSGQHLLSLINDILDLSKIEAGKMELSIEENVNLYELINSVMSTVSGLVKDKPIELQNEIPEDLPTVRADPIKVRQVLINLFSNAAKFTEEGSIRIQAAEREGTDGRREVVISVIDSGPGIAPEDQEKLFKPFSQVDGSPTRKTGGTGLGLSISRYLVDMHGGEIWVESTPGQGSQFFFSLPVSTAVASIEIPERSHANGVVMCVDDEDQIIALYERYLSEHGLQVVPVTSAKKAVEVARVVQPNAITLDINMPGGGGWGVLEALKNYSETEHIPVIICSVLDERVKGAQMGAVDYLLKPILEDDFVAAVKKLGIGAETK